MASLPRLFGGPVRVLDFNLLVCGGAGVPSLTRLGSLLVFYPALACGASEWRRFATLWRPSACFGFQPSRLRRCRGAVADATRFLSCPLTPHLRAGLVNGVASRLFGAVFLFWIPTFSFAAVQVPSLFATRFLSCLPTPHLRAGLVDGVASATLWRPSACFGFQPSRLWRCSAVAFRDSVPFLSAYPALTCGASEWRRFATLWCRLLILDSNLFVCGGAGVPSLFATRFLSCLPTPHLRAGLVDGVASRLFFLFSMFWVCADYFWERM
jgi:hypothetical protein